MAMHKRYDDKFRASAVVMLQAAGYPANPYKLEEVARSLSVPSRTLRRWYLGENNPPPVNVVTEQKRELTEVMRDFVYKLLDAMPDKIEDATLQQASTTLGIVIDKIQLLSGKPTERTELTDGLTDTERSARIAALFESARTRRAGSAANGE